MGKDLSNRGGVNYLALLAQSIIDTSVKAVNVSFLAKIIKVTPPTVSVQPLALTVGSNKKEAAIEGVRVLVPPWNTSQKINYKAGDHVACVVLDHDTTHYNHKDFFRQMTTTPHLVNNTFVVGKMAEKEDFDG